MTLKDVCFMASNGLVANPTKTVFMILGGKRELTDEEKTIKVGDSLVTASTHTKLLGVTMDDKQNWNEQFTGKGGLIASLNTRLFIIRRIANQIPHSQRKKLINSLWMSKLRYGLQICSRVRCTDLEPKTNNMRIAQITQNKMLRFLVGAEKKEHNRIKDMLETVDLPSVNQLAATIKLTETWKAVNVENYPVSLLPIKTNTSD